MKNTILYGILSSGAGSLWWGIIGVLYFKSVSFVDPLELIVHRTVRTAFLLLFTISIYSKWNDVFLMFFKTRKTLFHLEYMLIVKRSKKAVQTVL